MSMPVEFITGFSVIPSDVPILLFPAGFGEIDPIGLVTIRFRGQDPLAESRVKLWSNDVKITLGLIIACALAITVAAESTPDSPKRTLPHRLSSDETRGTTIPSKEVDLMFSMPGLIGEVNVKDGDVIKVGQVLAIQDTSVEQAALAREEYEFKSTVQQRAAVAQHELAAVQVKRQERMKANDVASAIEYEEAKVELLIAELKIELANEDTEKKRLDIEKLKKQIERMQIISQIAGVVRKVEAAVGRSGRSAEAFHDRRRSTTR